MTVQELKFYLSKMDYEETQKGEFSKVYLIGKNKDVDGLTIIYKVNKSNINVYYKTFNKKIKRFKGKLKSIKIRNDGSLGGLKQVA